MNTVSDTIDLCLIIPCYNEEGYLLESVRQIVSVLNQTKYSFEIIFVDDMSRDGTRCIIDDLVRDASTHSRRIFNKRNLGRGGAVMRGINRARAKWVGFIDVDLEVGAHYIPFCLVPLAQGADVVIAQRIYKLSLRGMLRHMASRCYSALVHVLLKLPLSDTETGFKFFNRLAILPILPHIKDRGWFWDTEIMARCIKHKLVVVEKQCLFIRRSDKTSSVHLLRDSFRYFISLVKNMYELRTTKK